MGKFYKKDWDGQYRPDTDWLGNEKATDDLFGPQVKTDLLTGKPVPKTDWLGNPEKAADGTPLYQTTPGGWGGLIALVVVLTLAVLAALAWITWKLFGWWLPRTAASIGRDINSHGLSLQTVGWLSPVFLAAILGVAVWMQPRPSYTSPAPAYAAPAPALRRPQVG